MIIFFFWILLKRWYLENPEFYESEVFVLHKIEVCVQKKIWNRNILHFYLFSVTVKMRNYFFLVLQMVACGLNLRLPESKTFRKLKICSKVFCNYSEFIGFYALVYILEKPDFKNIYTFVVLKQLYQDRLIVIDYLKEYN